MGCPGYPGKVGRGVVGGFGVDGWEGYEWVGLIWWGVSGSECRGRKAPW